MNFSLAIKVRRPGYRFFDYLLVYSFFVLTLYIYLIDYENEYISNTRYVLLAIAAIRGYYICIKKKFWLPMLLAIFFSVNYFICIIFQQSVNLPFSSYTYTILYIGLAILLLEESYGIIGSGILLTACVGIILLRYLRGVNPNRILTFTSRNYISILVLFVLILFYLALLKQGVDGYFALLIPAVLFLIICAIGYGRGGILAGTFLFGALLVYESFKVQNTWRRTFIRIIALVIVLGVIIYLAYNNLLIFFMGKYTVSTTSDERIAYWNTFLNNNTKSITNLLFGSNTSLIRTDHNLHNSYLQCYASYGLIAVITVIVMIIRSYVNGIKSKDYVLLILMSVLFIRAFTDRLFFQGYCEVFLYYFLLYWEYKNVNKNSG